MPVPFAELAALELSLEREGASGDVDVARGEPICDLDRVRTSSAEVHWARLESVLVL